MPQKPVTEQQILDAMEEYSEAWVEQLVRRSKNQRLVLSDETICTVGNYLEMPELMDEVVKVRMEERGAYTLAELNPPIGTHSVCEVVTPAMVRRLLTAAGGRFTSDEAYRFCDYHLINVDDELMEQVVQMSDLSRWDAELILSDSGYTGDIDALLSRGSKAKTPAASQGSSTKTQRRRPKASRIILVIFAIVAVVVGIIFGGVLVVGVILVIFVLALLTGGSSTKPKKEEFPDMRSDYNRRAWADDHNFEADGDSDHNWEADGDRP